MRKFLERVVLLILSILILPENPLGRMRSRADHVPLMLRVLLRKSVLAPWSTTMVKVAVALVISQIQAAGLFDADRVVGLIL